MTGWSKLMMRMPLLTRAELARWLNVSVRHTYKLEARGLRRANLEGPVRFDRTVVAVFLAGLVVLGGQQRWWLEPLLLGITALIIDGLTGQAMPSTVAVGLAPTRDGFTAGLHVSF